ncbi:MAG TPA: hypothetical protein VHE53_02430 [Patescibacteria group bacterium]|nr:hypothetical protein [Patescibacteria group bacterium]
MKFLKLLSVKSGKEEKKISDFYQASINKAGKAEIEKMVKIGVKMPVFML